MRHWQTNQGLNQHKRTEIIRTRFVQVRPTIGVRQPTREIVYRAQGQWYLCVYIYIYINLSIDLSIYPSIHPSIHLSVCLFLYLCSIHMCVCIYWYVIRKYEYMRISQIYFVCIRMFIMYLYNIYIYIYIYVSMICDISLSANVYSVNA